MDNYYFLCTVADHLWAVFPADFLCSLTSLTLFRQWLLANYCVEFTLIAHGKKKSAYDSKKIPSVGRPSALVNTQVIYYADNLDQLKKFSDECIGHICIDPPLIRQVCPPSVSRNQCSG
jgi:hypothetical protein